MLYVGTSSYCNRDSDGGNWCAREKIQAHGLSSWRPICNMR